MRLTEDRAHRDRTSALRKTPERGFLPLPLCEDIVKQTSEDWESGLTRYGICQGLDLGSLSLQNCVQ